MAKIGAGIDRLREALAGTLGPDSTGGDDPWWILSSLGPGGRPGSPLVADDPTDPIHTFIEAVQAIQGFVPEVRLGRCDINSRDIPNKVFHLYWAILKADKLSRERMREILTRLGLDNGAEGETQIVTFVRDLQEHVMLQTMLLTLHADKYRDHLGQN